MAIGAPHHAKLLAGRWGNPECLVLRLGQGGKCLVRALVVSGTGEDKPKHAFLLATATPD